MKNCRLIIYLLKDTLLPVADIYEYQPMKGLGSFEDCKLYLSLAPLRLVERIPSVIKEFRPLEMEQEVHFILALLLK